MGAPRGRRRGQSMDQRLGLSTACTMVRGAPATAAAQATKCMVAQGNPLRMTGRARPAEKLAAQAAAVQAEEAFPKTRVMACCAVWTRPVVGNSSNRIADGLSKGARLTATGHPDFGHIVYQAFEKSNLDGVGGVSCETTPTVGSAMGRWKA